MIVCDRCKRQKPQEGVRRYVVTFDCFPPDPEAILPADLKLTVDLCVECRKLEMERLGSMQRQPDPVK